MALTIGRAGLDVDLTSPRSWDVKGDEVDFAVTISPDGASAASRVEEQTVLVEQLQGMVGSPDTPVVPVTWDAWPAVDGYYRLVSLDLSMVGAALAGAPWRLAGRLRRVSAFASPVVESRLLHTVRTDTAVAASAAAPLAGVPGEATVYRRGALGLGSLSSRSCEHPAGSGDAGSVFVDVWTGTDDQADAEWQVAPADFYEGACQVNRFLTTSAGATRAILGRQVPGGLDPNTGWVLGNGLVAVFPAEAVGGTAGAINVRSWAGAAYESATEVTVEIDQASIGPSSAPDSFEGVSITRNSPEVTTIRLLSSTGGVGIFTLDLTVRRGDRLVQGVLRTTEAFITQVSLSGETGSALTGGLRRSADDADGNRWVLTSALGSALGGNAGYGLASATLLDFGFGHEIGGSGSSAPDTAQDLANQYAAHVSQADHIVVP